MHGTEKEQNINFYLLFMKALWHITWRLDKQQIKILSVLLICSVVHSLHRPNAKFRTKLKRLCWIMAIYVYIEGCSFPSGHTHSVQGVFAEFISHRTVASPDGVSKIETVERSQRNRLTGTNGSRWSERPVCDSNRKENTLKVPRVC